MRRLRVWNQTRGTRLATQAGLADNYWLRLRGLLGRPPLRPGDGLLITPCRGVHMLGMKYPIDVAFLDGNGIVVGVVEDLAPGKKSAWFRTAKQALELPAGLLAATGTREGDRILIEDAQTVGSAISSDLRGTRSNPSMGTA